MINPNSKQDWPFFARSDRGGITTSKLNLIENATIAIARVYLYSVSLAATLYIGCVGRL